MFYFYKASSMSSEEETCVAYSDETWVVTKTHISIITKKTQIPRKIEHGQSFRKWQNLKLKRIKRIYYNCPILDLV